MPCHWLMVHNDPQQLHAARTCARRGARPGAGLHPPRTSFLTERMTSCRSSWSTSSLQLFHFGRSLLLLPPLLLLSTLLPLLLVLPLLPLLPMLPPLPLLLLLPALLPLLPPLLLLLLLPSLLPALLPLALSCLLRCGTTPIASLKWSWSR